MNKKIQFVIIVIAAITAGFLGGYLFKQSAKLKKLEKPEIGVEKHSSENKTVASKEVEEKGPIFEKKIIESPQKTLKQEPEITSSKKEGSSLEVIKRWVDEYIITPYFIEDLVNYILNVYYPPNTKQNQTDKPKLNVSLKVLNARYGLELIGFRIEGYSVEKARQKILNTILDPDLLQKQYEKYSDIFINELIDRAKEEEREFIKDGKIEKRTLTKQEIYDLLIALSNYVDDLSDVLMIITSDNDYLNKLNKFLKTEEITMHKNFVLNQVLNEYRKEKLKLMENNEEKGLDESKMKRLEIQKEKIIKEYQFYLRKRERLRTSIINSIIKQKPSLKLDSGEIIYISEWVYRRINQGHTLDDIKKIAEILGFASKKMREKAEDLIAS